jgi:seryl-tRNA synthetase
MLDPRTLAERREEIAESCRRRDVAIDVDGLIALYEREAAATTRVNEANRLRNEHQKAGKGKLSPAKREAHVETGRRLKEDVARLEAERTAASEAFREVLATVPNLIHPDVPVGGEEDFKELRRVGEPTRFDFRPVDHLELGQKLDLIDFEGGARVSGKKFYFL